jgi:hypothetical protein
MSGAKIIEEMSQFYDIKQVNYENDCTIYYIIHCDVNIGVGIRFFDGSYHVKNNETLRAYIDKIILLVNKLDEIFEFTYKNENDTHYDMFGVICVGYVELHFQFHKNYIFIKNYTFEKIYYNVCEVIEYLKQACPECIKSSDIKIALKD